jgi:hypothetical protein
MYMTSLDRFELNERCDQVFGHVPGVVEIDPHASDHLAVLVADYSEDSDPPGPVILSLAQARHLRDLLDAHIRLPERGSRHPGRA